ncbi:hypothetical protein [Hwanghaeella sp.]|uniref:hypothetical protein n=1 Tax=Hwanghaeella sp. TaxID=2605943 RepID=UPI003CCBF0F6
MTEKQSLHLDLDTFESWNAEFERNPMALAEAFGVDPNEEDRERIVCPMNAAGLVMAKIGAAGVEGRFNANAFESQCRANPYAALFLISAMFQGDDSKDLPPICNPELLAPALFELMPEDVRSALAELYDENPILMAEPPSNSIN